MAEYNLHLNPHAWLCVGLHVLKPSADYSRHQGRNHKLFTTAFKAFGARQIDLEEISVKVFMQSNSAVLNLEQLKLYVWLVFNQSE